MKKQIILLTFILGMFFVSEIRSQIVREEIRSRAENAEKLRQNGELDKSLDELNEIIKDSPNFFPPY